MLSSFAKNVKCKYNCKDPFKLSAALWTQTQHLLFCVPQEQEMVGPPRHHPTGSGKEELAQDYACSDQNVQQNILMLARI